MLLVRVKLGFPVFFCQVRSGKDKKPFKMIKFRTMTNDKDEKGDLLPDEQRFTKFGHGLRSTSLDELPELINIIKGDMSVIGPRPLQPRYDTYYTERELKRFQVRGGLISPESVDKDPFISWDKQLEYDASYAENISLKEDCRIFWLVFRMLFYRYEEDLGGWTREGLDVERSKKS
jgi:lipopolysaccharide/colanic/teichoic acid biosynthesis glycosyltransferase